MKFLVRRARRLRRMTHEVPRVRVLESRPARHESANIQYYVAKGAARGARRMMFAHFDMREYHLVPG